ncbi:FtsQ-type POTRA domain-containing protein [Granulicella sp. 5B5]|uniref:cell division protein FtsQ/DivIB n=1 Tax=Granulicella sp. 5B5 TaxID=1617967 RepID=UPI0015F75DAC|nr:FtsQ-type POTRA domain-containing protein [Granulicella sp. 5B5]
MGKRATSAAAVLDAPEERYAPVAESGYRGPVPAPAGALQRGLNADPAEPFGYNADTDDDDYMPRRGKFRPTLKSLLRSRGGRGVVGVLALVAVGALAVGAAAVRYYLLQDPRFVVASSDDIQISGNTHLTREQLLGVFGGDLERNVFRVPLGEREADLQNLPWVEQATVMRLLPNQLRVQIVERVPVAFARQGTQIGLVDGHGELLDMGTDVRADAKYSFPVLTGINAADPESTREARMQLYQQFMQALDSGGQHFSKTVSEVDITEPDDLKALIASPDPSKGGSPEVLVHFGDDKFLSRYDEFEKLLPEWRQQYPKLAAADMRYEGQIVLEMRKDGDTVAQAASAQTQVSEARPGAPSVAAAVAAVKPAVLPVVKSAGAAKLVRASAPVVRAPAKSAPKKAAKPVARKAVAKKAAAKKKKAHAADGRDAANDKLFAELAAARKAK